MKILDLISFHDAVLAFDILPEFTINAVTILIPSIEIICGFCLVTNLFTYCNSLILGLLVLSFIIVVSVSLIRELDIECGCFGSLMLLDKLSYKHLVLDILLLLSISVIITEYPKNKYNFEDAKTVTIIIFFLSVLLNLEYKNNSYEIGRLARNITFMNPHEAYSLIQKSDAIVFDARSIVRYNFGHISDARPLPKSDFKEYYSEYPNLKKDRELIVYCDSEQCGAAQAVGVKLIKKGHTKIFVIKGGYDSWKTEMLK